LVSLIAHPQKQPSQQGWAKTAPDQARSAAETLEKRYFGDPVSRYPFTGSELKEALSNRNFAASASLDLLRHQGSTGLG